MVSDSPAAERSDAPTSVNSFSAPHSGSSRASPRRLPLARRVARWLRLRAACVLLAELLALRAERPAAAPFPHRSGERDLPRDAALVPRVVDVLRQRVPGVALRAHAAASCERRRRIVSQEY